MLRTTQKRCYPKQLPRYRLTRDDFVKHTFTRITFRSWSLMNGCFTVGFLGTDRQGPRHLQKCTCKDMRKAALGRRERESSGGQQSRHQGHPPRASGLGRLRVTGGSTSGVGDTSEQHERSGINLHHKGDLSLHIFTYLFHLCVRQRERRQKQTQRSPIHFFKLFKFPQYTGLRQVKARSRKFIQASSTQ